MTIPELMRQYRTVEGKNTESPTRAKLPTRPEDKARRISPSRPRPFVIRDLTVEQAVKLAEAE